MIAPPRGSIELATAKERAPPEKNPRTLTAQERSSCAKFLNVLTICSKHAGCSYCGQRQATFWGAMLGNLIKRIASCQKPRQQRLSPDGYLHHFDSKREMVAQPSAQTQKSINHLLRVKGSPPKPPQTTPNPSNAPKAEHKQPLQCSPAPGGDRFSTPTGRLRLATLAEGSSRTAPLFEVEKRNFSDAEAENRRAPGWSKPLM